MEPTWHFVIACVLGALVLGYLLSEWVYQSTLDKTQLKLRDLADQIEELVVSNDGAAILIEQLRNNMFPMSEANGALLNKIKQLEALLQLVPEK